MTQFLIDKIQELNCLIQLLAKRQKEIKKDLNNKSLNHFYKNKIAEEKFYNSGVLRIMHWILMMMKGMSLEKRITMDPNYIKWMYCVKSFEIRSYAANLLNLKEEDYILFGHYKYCPQISIYYYIYDYLFPANQTGIFGIQTEEGIETDVWRNTFEDQVKKERSLLNKI